MTKQEVINLSLKATPTEELVKLAKKHNETLRAVVIKELANRSDY